MKKKKTMVDLRATSKSIFFRHATMVIFLHAVLWRVCFDEKFTIYFCYTKMKRKCLMERLIEIGLMDRKID